MKTETKIIRTYKELSRIESYNDRYEYLKLGGGVGESTFGFDRILNQLLYRSQEWKRVRNEVIIRDNGFDMGFNDYPICGRIIIHHMNPLTVEDIYDRNSDVYNPEFLICVSHSTHNAIHYGDSSLLQNMPKERCPGDTCPW